MLLDTFGRVHDYLRISLTDNCNFRCTYCMPDEDYAFLSSGQLMSADEIVSLATRFVSLGVKKIRLTGGEPLVRKDVDEILERLAALPVELLISTNGMLVHKHIDAFKKAGIRSLNISLDTLRPDEFRRITGRDKWQQVWDNILLLLEQDFRVKINVVARKGHIEQELHDFILLTRTLPLHIRFIEFMPFAGNHWDSRDVITADQMLALAADGFDVVKLRDEPHATAKKFKVIGHEGTFAFITTMSHQFCGDCNRLRLTAEGKIKNCLFGSEELDLLAVLRAGGDVKALIRQSVAAKHAAMGGQFENGYERTDAHTLINRSMIGIGG